MNNFWNIETDKKKKRCKIDLFGYVGGSKNSQWGKGFNESDFLDEFRQIPSDSELNISINSFGGAVYTGLSIYSLLKAHEGPITFRIDGAAMSAATIITSVPGARVIMPKGSMMMIHKVSSIAIGNNEDMRKTADDIEKLENNIIDIYAEKTGRSAEEIKEKVDAETYFTAEEAVEFGLADEVDETREVKNVSFGDFVMLNGLKADSRYFANMPSGYCKAEKPQAEKPQASAIQKEVPVMDLKTLKAEHPDLVEAIRKEAFAEGVKQERERIKSIEDIAVAGHAEMVNDAKFVNAISAEKLAVAILKADKERGEKMLAARQADAAALAGIEAEGNTGMNPEAEKKAKEEAKMKEYIAAGKRGFNRI